MILSSEPSKLNKYLQERLCSLLISALASGRRGSEPVERKWEVCIQDRAGPGHSALSHHQATTWLLGQPLVLCSGKERCPCGSGQSESGEGKALGTWPATLTGVCAHHACPCLLRLVCSFTLLTRTRQKVRVPQGPPHLSLNGVLPVDISLLPFL